MSKHTRIWLVLGVSGISATLLCVMAFPVWLAPRWYQSHTRRSRTIDPETACGPVSLAVVSHLLSRPRTIAEFHRWARAGELGLCSISDLLDALKKAGFSAAAVRYNQARPPSHDLPMILFVDRDHFLTVFTASSRRVVVIDPPDEPVVMAWTDLSERWRGEAIVVGRSDAEVKQAIGNL